MKIIRFDAGSGPESGILDGDMIAGLDGDVFGDCKPLSPRLQVSEVKLLAPCVPSKIVAVGLNYRDHAREMGLSLPEAPVLFLKPPTTVIGPDDAIMIPPAAGRIDHEAELGIVIRRRTKNAGPEEAGKVILGYTCANDVTARDLQKKDVQWTRAKSFDTFCPIGPWIETGLDPSNVLVEAYLNGERRQSSRTGQLIFNVPFLVSFISQVMTLEPGDLIITGTPSGIGPLQPGDTVEVRIEGIGSLKNSVRLQS
ncbi:MAG TPA: fumarylacetoacetate hydrolase family protein [Nitrospirota bacterium]|nr:fumarylacetoacetate hydrolase family protein [Nitrospirota bacterium]